MAAQKGSNFLLKENSTGTPATVGGLRSTSMTINGEMVDITDKDSNAFISSGNDKARDILQGGGIRSMSLSASGVFTDSSTENILRGFAFAMILGVLIGTYSSIFVAAPVLKFFKVSYKTLEKKEEKIVP